MIPFVFAAFLSYFDKEGNVWLLYYFEVKMHKWQNRLSSTGQEMATMLEVEVDSPQDDFYQKLANITCIIQKIKKMNKLGLKPNSGCETCDF